MTTRLVGICALVGALGCQLPPVSPGTPAVAEEYRVGPPDLLAVTVLPEPAIEREVTVRPDGRISLDLIGDVAVEGRTIAEVRADIAERIRRFIVSPTVSVDLTESRSRRFYVFGQVRRPGSFPLVGRVTAVEALAEAGGGNLFASMNGSRLSRASEDGGAYPVRFNDIMQRADAATNYELMPGDVIWVPPSLSARIGFALQRALFPISAIFGVGREGAGTASAF